MSLVLAAGPFAGRMGFIRAACAALQGTRLEEATEGLDALALALREDPDCVLLDLELPGLDALDLITRLRTAPRAASLPLLVLEPAGADPARALASLEAGADTVVDSVGNEAADSARLAAQLRSRIGPGVARADKPDARARENVDELHRQREDLSRALSEKNTLVAEIHHRVKNDLQVVSSMLSIQSATAGPEVSRLLESARGRVRTMAAVHEQLYRNGNFDRLNLAQSLPMLLSLIREAFGEVDGRILFRSSVVPISVPVRLAIPVSLVINEAVSNSLQHAFPDDRTGAVDLLISESVPGRLLCVVADDGIGIPVSENRRGLGISLIRSLADQLDARLELSIAGGTRWEMEFDIAS